jgi:hypothetical protein
VNLDKQHINTFITAHNDQLYRGVGLLSSPINARQCSEELLTKKSLRASRYICPQADID